MHFVAYNENRKQINRINPSLSFFLQSITTKVAEWKLIMELLHPIPQGDRPGVYEGGDYVFIQKCDNLILHLQRCASYATTPKIPVYVSLYPENPNPRNAPPLFLRL